MILRHKYFNELFDILTIRKYKMAGFFFSSNSQAVIHITVKWRYVTLNIAYLKLVRLIVNLYYFARVRNAIGAKQLQWDLLGANDREIRNESISVPLIIRILSWNSIIMSLVKMEKVWQKCISTLSFPSYMPACIAAIGTKFVYYFFANTVRQLN